MEVSVYNGAYCTHQQPEQDRYDVYLEIKLTLKQNNPVMALSSDIYTVLLILFTVLDGQGQ